jgi:cytidylate kinase
MTSLHDQHLQAILKELRAADYTPPTAPKSESKVRFITISRQAGAGGKTLAAELTKAMNQIVPSAEPWCAWDRELVQKVSDDHQIRKEFIQALEDADHGWFSEMVDSLADRDYPGDFKIYRTVAMTIRALAGIGRSVIVGRGGVFITEDLPGGIHIRLVAPVEHRVLRMAHRMDSSLDEAAEVVKEIDRNRAAFYHRFWPKHTLAPESFTLTLNTAQLSDAQMVACVLPLVVGPVAPREKPRVENRDKENRYVPKTGTHHAGAL